MACHGGNCADHCEDMITAPYSIGPLHMLLLLLLLLAHNSLQCWHHLISETTFCGETGAPCLPSDTTTEQNRLPPVVPDHHHDDQITATTITLRNKRSLQAPRVAGEGWGWGVTAHVGGHCTCCCCCWLMIWSSAGTTSSSDTTRSLSYS